MLFFSAPELDESVIWDGPGGCMSLVPVPDDLCDRWSLKVVLDGISKNHGMRITALDRRRAFLLKAPNKPGFRWKCEKLLEHKIS